MNNDQEWRNHLICELKEIKKDVCYIRDELVNLKIKVAGVSSLIGSIVTYFASKLL